MNCANHPDTPVAAYCQFCGKPLCAQCVHKINNIIGCEPCLAARIGATAGAQFSQTPEGVHFSDGKGNEYHEGPGYQYISSAPGSPGNAPPPSWGATPWLAFVLGWIPGVGAMYNGQFAKALAHLLIFAMLVGLKDTHGAFGILVFGWVIYQVFDAYQTAIARRDGLPLPNPLGLNDIGHWFGARTTPVPPTTNPWISNAGNPNPNPATENPAAGQGSPYAAEEFTAPYVAPPMPPAPPAPPIPPDPLGQAGSLHGVPTGAVVLIVLGVAFLLANLGILSTYWLERGWPVLLIGLGVWLVIRRSQTPPYGGAR